MIDDGSEVLVTNDTFLNNCNVIFDRSSDEQPTNQLSGDNNIISLDVA